MNSSTPPPKRQHSAEKEAEQRTDNPQAPQDAPTPQPPSQPPLRQPGEDSSAKLLVEAQGLTKSFWLEHRRIDVLQRLDLQVYATDMIAVVGPSGAGKSTLLHLLGTLDTPTDGSISFEGQDIFTLTEDELAHFRNRTIGFVFQSHYLLPEFSALENVMMPALIQRMKRSEALGRAEEMLEWVGLKERLRHRPGELSGGERQRVALSRALVLRPRLLLADEPTGNLDEGTGAGIHDLLLDLNQRWQVTLIVVTHNLGLANQMQRCLSLEGGQLTEMSDLGEKLVDL